MNKPHKFSLFVSLFTFTYPISGDHLLMLETPAPKKKVKNRGENCTLTVPRTPEQMELLRFTELSLHLLRRTSGSANLTQTEVWSLGCILLTLYTGQRPFPVQSSLQHLALMQRVIGT